MVFVFQGIHQHLLDGRVLDEGLGAGLDLGSLLKQPQAFGHGGGLHDGKLKWKNMLGQTESLTALSASNLASVS